MIRARQKLGKYQIERKLGEGGFASVFRALDTIEGTRVALKIPHPQFVNKETLEEFRSEIRLMAKLQHPNILGVRNADVIGGHLVVAFPLGDRTLAERLQNRISTSLALDFTEQILDAVAFAHHQKIIHCDIKPENLILFADNRLMLTDFGIAKIAQRTIRGSGSGTVGHVAPEQAMGQPSFRSDVFSIGLISYRMFSGHWPAWPFEWPPEGIKKVRGRIHANLIDLLKRSMEVNPRKRFRDADQMLNAFRRIKSRAIRSENGSSDQKKGKARKRTNRDWRTMRFRQWRKRYGQSLGVVYSCEKCNGPVTEAMQCCPWCGSDRRKFKNETRFPQCCPRCYRGMKLDWQYCPWCYGPGFEPPNDREYSDSRYVAKCSNTNCERKDLMPFMRYCPWCRRKVRRKWKLPESKDLCGSCKWGVDTEFWNYCPWCSSGL